MKGFKIEVADRIKKYFEDEYDAEVSLVAELLDKDEIDWKIRVKFTTGTVWEIIEII